MTQQIAPPATGAFCWFELNTRNVDGVKQFYAELFGWTTTPSKMPGGYHHWHDKDGVMFGGIMDMNDPRWGQIPSHWMSYIGVDDCNAMVEKVAALGGFVCVPPTDIPNVGRFSVINDPSGPTLSVIQLNDPKPIAPVIVWNECMTRNAAKAKDFYEQLFGWTFETKPMGDQGDYTICMNNGEGIGGILQMDGPQFAQVPPHWLNYIGTQDVDRDAQKVITLGGQLVVPPMDIPDNMGRFCVFQDNGDGHAAMYQSPAQRC